MLALGLAVIIAVLGQSVFFLVRALKRGKELGVSSLVIKSTIISSTLFTIAPALAIVATILALSPALGIILPWIRLSVIGNITQETTAATAALDAVGNGASLAYAVTDETVFSIVIWVMTLGSSLPLLLIPLLLKKLQKGIKKVAGGKDSKWTDAMSAAAFIGLICAFIARSIAGMGSHNVLTGEYNYDGAGIVSVAALLSSVVCMLALQKIAEKKSIRWLETFSMPMAMFFAMGVVVVLAQILPESLYLFEWRIPEAPAVAEALEGAVQ